MKKFESPIACLKEIDAWLSFNTQPSSSELLNMRLDIQTCLADEKDTRLNKELGEELHDIFKRLDINELIESITCNAANLDFIANGNRGKINGSLHVDITRIMREYVKQETSKLSDQLKKAKKDAAYWKDMFEDEKDSKNRKQY